jgi:hypothetical protein
MAIAINSVFEFPFKGSSPMASPADAVVSANRIMVSVKYTISGAAGGNIRPHDIGLVSVDHVVAGDANTVYDDAAADNIVAGGTNGDHYFTAVGIAKGETQNYNAALVDPG